jgi:hypothetical protein
MKIPRTFIVVTKLDATHIHSTYINLSPSAEPYIMGITLGEPPWHPIGNPTIPTEIGDTAVTMKYEGEV